MKNILFNLSASAVAFYIPFQIALLTDIGLVKNAVLIAFVIQWVLFIPAYLMQTEKFYDLAGSLTYISIISYVFYKSSEFNLGNLILSVFIIIWAVRLGSFLFFRIQKAGEDKRFRDIKPSPTRFFMTWTLQGMWISICSACAITAISTSEGILMNTLFFVGAITFILGFLIEVIADNQKTKFRSHPNNKDKFISTGLWSYSRHPNYLGEITLWTGVAIMSFSSLSGLQLITLISPVFTYLLLVYVSGVRLLEARGKRKWGHLESYQEYIKNTPTLLFK
jgi:steroid 5-alpha reductase family enzyme